MEWCGAGIWWFHLNVWNGIYEYLTAMCGIVVWFGWKRSQGFQILIATDGLQAGNLPAQQIVNELKEFSDFVYHGLTYMRFIDDRKYRIYRLI